MSVRAWEMYWAGSAQSAERRTIQAANQTHQTHQTHQAQRTHQQRGRRSGPAPDAGVFRAELSGFQEVPPILTNARGSFEARVAEDGSSISYTLTFTDLSSPSTAAHLHFGPPGVNGEVFAFLCGGDGKPACPGQGGTISGTLTSADIRGIPSQGLPAGDLAGAIRIIRSGLAYANVHSTEFPAGEIRGQVR